MVAQGRRVLASTTLIALAALLLPGCEQSATSAASGWVVIEQASPIDDSPGVLLTKPAEKDVELGGVLLRPRLMVECIEGASVLTVETPGVRVCAEMTSVTLRFDMDDARSEEWLCTDDQMGVGLSSQDDLPILREMEAHRRMLIRFRSPGKGTMLAAFDISEFGDHLPKVKEACAWE